MSVTVFQNTDVQQFGERQYPYFMINRFDLLCLITWFNDFGRQVYFVFIICAQVVWCWGNCIFHRQGHLEAHTNRPGCQVSLRVGVSIWKERVSELFSEARISLFRKPDSVSGSELQIPRLLWNRKLAVLQSIVISMFLESILFQASTETDIQSSDHHPSDAHYLAMEGRWIFLKLTFAVNQSNQSCNHKKWAQSIA